MDRIVTKTTERCLPPLPDIIPDVGPLLPSPSIRVRTFLTTLRGFSGEACYLIRFTPVKPALHYDGTLRVEVNLGNIIASGDLYVHELERTGLRDWRLPTEPNPSAGIPIFPRKYYSFYVRVVKVGSKLESRRVSLASGDVVRLIFELYRFHPTNDEWSNEGTFAAHMTRSTAPEGYPAPWNFWRGEVKNRLGVVIGDLTMGWISPHLRRATVEIDKVSASEFPLNNGNSEDWRTVYNTVGWKFTAVQGDSNVAEPSGAGWNKAELHQEMLDWRDSADLDRQWRYHLICVQDIEGYRRGVMYDHNGGDSNNIPREGAAIESHWVFPNEAKWGTCQGMRFGTAAAPYFRTAVHELSHAMNLYHPSASDENHIMQITPQIADNAVATGVQFPNNIAWSFNHSDRKDLRHRPDIIVRPGGARWASAIVGQSPISPSDMIAEAKGLKLQVHPLRETVPLGAPVRINFALVNTAKEPLSVPASLRMQMSHVRGKVIDPSGTVRTYSPIIRCLDNESRLRLLKPGQSMSHSLTLLRGPQGALFPFSGVHQVIVEVTWELEEHTIGLTGKTSVMVMPPVDEAHAEAALKILSTPDALLTLVIGGDHLKEGIEAIQAGLGHTVLRPHFALIEAKRLGTRFRKRKADFNAVAKLLDKATIMSPAEVKRVAKLVKDAGRRVPSNTVKRIAKVLKMKIGEVGTDDETKKLVDSLWSVQKRKTKRRR